MYHLILSSFNSKILSYSFVLTRMQSLNNFKAFALLSFSVFIGSPKLQYISNTHLRFSWQRIRKFSAFSLMIKRFLAFWSPLRRSLMIVFFSHSVKLSLKIALTAHSDSKNVGKSVKSLSIHEDPKISTRTSYEGNNVVTEFIGLFVSF